MHNHVGMLFKRLSIITDTNLESNLVEMKSENNYSCLLVKILSEINPA